MVLPRNNQEEVLLNLYGYSFYHPETNHPLYGSHIEKPLSNGWHDYLANVVSDEEGNLNSTYQPQIVPRRLTIRNLAHHFGYMTTAEETMSHLVSMSHGRITGKDLQDILAPIEARAQQKFFAKVVIPAREDLLLQGDQSCYLYSVPAISDETDYLTGKPVHKRGELALTLLPFKVQLLVEQNVDDSTVSIIARQVIYVVIKRCNNKMILTSDQLRRALNEWPERLNDVLSLQRVQHVIEEKHPYLMSPEIKKLLS